jgi:thiol:disulfide interchange protein DsbC
VTAGANLFYVDRGARYLVIGRVYDMETPGRDGRTAARDQPRHAGRRRGQGQCRGRGRRGGEIAAAAPARGESPRQSAPPRCRSLGFRATEQSSGATGIGQSVTVFTDFRCGYCRALTSVLRSMDVKVVERPISVLGSRDIADRVYCAKNREEALHAAYAGEPFKAAANATPRVSMPTSSSPVAWAERGRP